MFNLADKIKEVKKKIKPIEDELIIVITIVLVALIGFGLVRLYKIRENKTPITIENIFENGPDKKIGERAAEMEKLFVASKSGTKYHYPWCPSALKIKEENKIWFSTREEAEKAGYTPAANCKGL
jgi:hypothetical protein